MSDPRTTRLMADLVAGPISRRQALSVGLRLSLATPVISALLAASPAGASPAVAAPALVPAR